jgi:hypothetical protein
VSAILASTLMMSTKKASKMLIFDLTLMHLIAQEDIGAFTSHACSELAKVMVKVTMMSLY